MEVNIIFVNSNNAVPPQMYGPGRSITSKSNCWASFRKPSRSVVVFFSKRSRSACGWCRFQGTYVWTTFNPNALTLRSLSSQYCDNQQWNGVYYRCEFWETSNRAFRLRHRTGHSNFPAAGHKVEDNQFKISKHDFLIFEFWFKILRFAILETGHVDTGRAKLLDCHLVWEPKLKFLCIVKRLPASLSLSLNVRVTTGKHVDKHRKTLCLPGDGFWSSGESHPGFGTGPHLCRTGHSRSWRSSDSRLASCPETTHTKNNQAFIQNSNSDFGR